MLESHLKNNRLYIGDRFSISFQRTLRIPDDDRIYPLPPGLGLFPIHEASNYPGKVPDEWLKRREVFLPMYQREALWLGFAAANWKPNAVKVCVGNINAISGTLCDGSLSDNPQSYIICPNQLWLDGINAGEGFTRQFVAMPLGQGYTIEAQVTEDEIFGGIQISVFDPKPGRFPDKAPAVNQAMQAMIEPGMAMDVQGEMGIGAGGKVKQKIYPDLYGIDTWDESNFGYVFAHIVNTEQYREITGLEPPPTPISAQTYSQHGFPWFDLYDEHLGDVAAPESLTTITSINAADSKGCAKANQDGSINITDEQTKRV